MDIKKFHKLGRAPGSEREDGVIKAADLEILRLDNDPNFPDNGRIEFEIEGGS